MYLLFFTHRPPTCPLLVLAAAGARSVKRQARQLAPMWAPSMHAGSAQRARGRPTTRVGARLTTPMSGRSTVLPRATKDGAECDMCTRMSR